MSRTGVTVAFSLLLVACIAGQAVTVRKLDALRPQATLEEFLYIPDATVLRRMSLGYSGLLADIYWTRAVQYFGKRLTHQVKSNRYDLLYPLLDITTSLDPYMIPAYRFGGTFLAQARPSGAGQPDKAIEILQKGIARNPKDWRLYYDLGFVYYMEQKDYKAASHIFQQAAEQPGAPELRSLAAMMATRGGDLQLAEKLWEITYSSTDDKHVKENARKHMLAVQTDIVIGLLQQRIELYRQRTGRLPDTWRDLIEARLLPNVPLDPTGKPFLLNWDGHVLVQHPEDLPFITKGLGAAQPSVKNNPSVE